MATKVIQTTPDLGIKIKLQKLPATLATTAPQVVNTGPALVLDTNGNILASLDPGDEYTCQGAASQLTGIKLINFPNQQSPYPNPTFVNSTPFASNYTVYLLPIGTFLNTAIAWTWGWQGDNVTQWMQVTMDDLTPGLLILDVQLCCNNGGNPNYTGTLVLTATSSDGATASVAIDFLVQGY